MYEQAFRLSYNNCIEALEKQVKCYLASLNILRLCNKEKTLVSRPKDTTEEELSLLPSQLRSTLVRPSDKKYKLSLNPYLSGSK